MRRRYLRVDADGVPMIVQDVWFNPVDLMFSAELFNGESVQVELEAVIENNSLYERSFTKEESALVWEWFDARTYRELMYDRPWQRGLLAELDRIHERYTRGLPPDSTRRGIGDYDDRG